MSSEIELLRKKRELELRKKMMLSQEKAASPQTPAPKPSPRETVRNILEGRGIDVLETARRYYPKEVAQVEETLAGLVESGRLKGPVSGEELYSFLRRIGLFFNMDVKIRVKEHGELKTLEQKFRDSR
ncbi:MAG TPA: DNA-binding protein [Candidatus Dormibacteraeota bacterium]|jgi:DNA-binding TFAR19-related protein (PDSD5 family)|nr:DNA-binding protein [Candidatus Dormibacteraeota bacterium]